MVSYLSEFNFGEFSFKSYLSEFKIGELSWSITSVSLTLMSYLCQLPQ